LLVSNSVCALVCAYVLYLFARTSGEVLGGLFSRIKVAHRHAAWHKLLETHLKRARSGLVCITSHSSERGRKSWHSWDFATYVK